MADIISSFELNNNVSELQQSLRDSIENFQGYTLTPFDQCKLLDKIVERITPEHLDI